MLIGRLGKKPEVNYIKPDVPVARFPLATSETYKSKEGDKREVTEWHNITAWRFTAKFCENFLDKGMLVYIEGKLQTRKWDGQDGVTRYSTDIVADNIKILEKRATQDSNPDYSQQQQEEPKQQQDIMAEDPFTNTSPELNSDIDDDLPF